VQRWWCVWPKYRALKEEDNEATAWFWFASWPIHYWFSCIFCGVADCYEGSFAFYLDWSSSICGGNFGQYESMMRLYFCFNSNRDVIPSALSLSLPQIYIYISDVSFSWLSFSLLHFVLDEATVFS
jgi:hypothetical protein